MKVSMVDINSIHPDPNNARRHDDKNIRAIKGSLKKFGQQKPIVVDHEQIILAGNGTHQAAIDLGWKEIAVVVTDLEGFNKMAYALADNRTAELADWNMETLDQQLDLLKSELDLTEIGFEDFSHDDWDSDIDEVEKENKNEDGLIETIKVNCKAEDKEAIKKKIKEALNAFESIAVS